MSNENLEEDGCNDFIYNNFNKLTAELEDVVRRILFRFELNI